MGKEKSERGEEEDVERGNWDNQCDFFLSCLGYAVGLSNVWRFPYLCYAHGGVTFLIAYLTMLLICGLPLFFLELVLGQYAGKGPIKLFGRIAPAFKGLGYGMVMISCLVVIYFNMILAWTIYYMFAGFASELPWTFCGTGDLTSRDCFQRDQEQACFKANGDDTFWDKKCTSVRDVCKNFRMTEAAERDDNDRLQCNDGDSNILLNRVYPRVSPSEDYFKRSMLGLEPDSSWSNMGGLKWELVLCLAAAWTIVCLCLIKGVQSSGKVVYFTALFPYLVLVILLIRGATLDGAYDGIIWYIVPTSEKLANLGDKRVWFAAATQIFYSLGLSFGGLITLSSYNKFTNNCHRDAILIAFANCGTSILAGFVVFSIIGFMAKQAAVPVHEVIKGGRGLAFIAYPEAVTQMPFPQLWSFLFFGMLFTLGLDTQFTWTETIITAIMDQYPNLRSHKGKVVICASIIGFILGLTMCTRGGIFMLDLMDWYSGSWGLFICAITEIIIIYAYGFRNILANIEEMGMKLPAIMQYYWVFMWTIATPSVLCFILIRTFKQYSPAFSSVTQENYYFPNGIQVLGWFMSLLPVFFILIGVPFQIYNRKINGKPTDFKSMISPNEKWGSALVTKAAQNNDGFGQTDLPGELSCNKYDVYTMY